MKGAAGADGVTPIIGENGHWFIGEEDTGVVAKGQDGVGIKKVEKTTEGNVDTYTITYTDDNTYEFSVTHGTNGTNGSDGLTPYIGTNGHWFIGEQDTGVLAQGKNGTDGTNGTNGTNGANGVGILKVEKIRSEGLVDTYTITLTNGATYDFTVTNGKDGILPQEDPDAPTPDGYFVYTLLSNNTYSVSGRYHNMPSYLRIPASYNGVAVTDIAEGAFKGCQSIVEVVIPPSVESLHLHAFEDCSNLKIVTFEEGTRLTSIGSLNAFAGCPIESAIIPPLADRSIGNPALKTVKYISNSKFPGSTGVSNKAFKDCTNLTSVTLLSNAGLINTSAFENCTALTSIEIPDTVKIISANAFKGCTGLRMITLSGVELLGEGVFEGCTGLIGASLSTKLTSIPDSTFSHCTSLRNVTIPASVTSIGSNAFRECYYLQSVTIPAKMEEIGSFAFESCVRLVDVWNQSALDIQKGKSTFGSVAAFALDVHSEVVNGRFWSHGDYLTYELDGKKYLVSYTGQEENVVIPSDVNVVNKYAFGHCESVKTVRFNKNVECIELAAFVGCTNLTDVFLCNGLTKIGAQAFGYCPSLTSIVIPATVNDISSSAFYGCQALSSIIVDEHNSIYYSENNCLIYKTDKSARFLMLGCNNSVIPSNVEYIYYSAFAACEELYSVVIPDTVYEIRSSAFTGCSNLGYVKIGSLVNKIEAYAFNNCMKLSSITIPVKVNTIGNYAFNNCIGLSDIYFEGTREQWEAVTLGTNAIPDGVTIHCRDDE